MKLTEYSLAGGVSDGPIALIFKEMASSQPYRANRLVTALEEFIWSSAEAGYLVAPDHPSPEIEIYIVPPRYVLSIPDAAALVAVDHYLLEIDVVSILAEYGGPGEERQWNEVKKLAVEELEARHKRRSASTGNDSEGNNDQR